MSEYIKRELAASSIAFETDMSLEQARKILGDLPSIDVTLCKDCKYSEWFSDDPEDGGCNLLPLKVAIDDFCSFAERKEQEDE